MPNWCFTDCAVIGEQKELDSLYEMMQDLQSREKSSIKNDFGVRWLGDLAVSLGDDWQNMAYKGSWEGLYKSDIDGHIAFFTESAWTPPLRLFEMIHNKFPSLEVLYIAQEDGMAIYQTNDTESHYFKGRYIVQLNTDDHEYLEYQFINLEEALEWASQCTGSEIRTIEDAQRLNDELSRTEDNYLFVHKVKVVA